MVPGFGHKQSDCRAWKANNYTTLQSKRNAESGHVSYMLHPRTHGFMDSAPDFVWNEIKCRERLKDCLNMLVSISFFHKFELEMLIKYKMHVVWQIILKKIVLIPGNCSLYRFKQNPLLGGPHWLSILPEVGLQDGTPIQEKGFQSFGSRNWWQKLLRVLRREVPVVTFRGDSCQTHSPLSLSF